MPVAVGPAPESMSTLLFTMAEPAPCVLMPTVENGAFTKLPTISALAPVALMPFVAAVKVMLFDVACWFVFVIEMPVVGDPPSLFSIAVAPAPARWMPVAPAARNGAHDFATVLFCPTVKPCDAVPGPGDPVGITVHSSRRVPRAPAAQVEMAALEPRALTRQSCEPSPTEMPSATATAGWTAAGGLRGAAA